MLYAVLLQVVLLPQFTVMSAALPTSMTFLAAATDLELPSSMTGNSDGTYWGMTVEQLKKTLMVQPATKQGEYSFADHMEVNPDVYLRKQNNGDRFEYYFYNQKLYKIYIVHSRQNSDQDHYKHRVSELIKLHGPPQNNYEEVYFGISVQHTLWEDKNNVFDLRFGAGFIYEVKINKAMAREKSLDILRKQSI